MALGRPAVVTWDGITLTNSSRQAMQVMVPLGCVLMVAASIALLLQFTDPRFAGTANTSAAIGCILVLALCGPGAIALFLSALIMLWPARVTDRIFDQFRRGELLADWRFTPSEWNEHVEAEVVRLNKTSALVWLWLVGPSAGIAAMILWIASHSVMARVETMAIVAACAAVALWLLRQIQKAFFRKRIATLRRNPRVLVGASAIYCGGFFKPWNVSMLVLQRARLLPGPPVMVELTIGTGQVVQAAGAVLSVASLAGGSVAAGGALANMQSQMLAPVPAGKLDDAVRVLQALLAPLPRMAAPVSADIAPAPRQPRRRPRPGRLWAFAAIMFVVGFVLFLVGDAQDAPPSSLQMAASVTGLFLWVAVLITAVVALTGSIRAYRSRHRARPAVG